MNLLTLDDSHSDEPSIVMGDEALLNQSKCSFTHIAARSATIAPARETPKLPSLALRQRERGFSRGIHTMSIG